MKLVRYGSALALMAWVACDKAPRPENVSVGGGAGAISPTVPPPASGDLATLPDAGSAPNVPAERDAAQAPPPPPTETFTKRALLASIASCVEPSFGELQAALVSLEAAAEAWAASPVDEAAAATVRSQWFAAALVMERVEVFRFGPLARSMEPGGLDLRDQLYAFPNDNPCVVDTTLVNRRYAEDTFPRTPVNGRGFAAIEYLAFYVGSTNACPDTIVINTNGSWAALEASALRERRAAYAAAVARDLRVRADALVRAWDPAGDDFHGRFVNAGDDTRVYPSEQAALNAVSHGMFYVEKELKDYKLAWPLGLVPECLSGSCPEAVEAPYARTSNAFMRENLRAFRQLFQGCGENNAGFGFDDWLDAVGSAELAARMLAGLANAEAAVDQLDPPIEESIYSAPEKVRAVHTALKQLTDLLKTEFVSVLDLELPMTSEGDND